MLLVAFAAYLGAPLDISSDKARYSPGQTVHFHIVGTAPAGARLEVRFYHLGRVVGQRSSAWNGQLDLDWAPPDAGHGFLAVAHVVSSDGGGLAEASCGVDVSSRWTEFPRYGYVAHFGPGLAGSAESVVAGLNRFHIDGLQFYDWQWRHHHPLPPSDEWVDIAKRQTSGETVRAFIHAAHDRNIACMAYNLGFGGVDGFEEDKISPDWMLYYDRQKQKPYALNMPGGWATTKLDLFNPANEQWRGAIFPREKAAVGAFGFDGWHMDQLGDLGKVFSADGTPVMLKDGFPELLAGAKNAVPGDLIFNNVGGYCLDETLHSPTDAMYLEAWPFAGQKSYADLRNAVEQMRSGGKSAILAAYMDYERGKAFEGSALPGRFNLSGVLLTDATIFSSGGFHIELGDLGQMLCNEYFPNHNLEPDAELLARLKSYYDFAVAYEDLLSARDVRPVAVPASVDGVWACARKCREGTVVHLINVARPESLDWRDPKGEFPAPRPLLNLTVRLSGSWHSAYVATPDDGVGELREIPIKDGSIVVPRLDYWTMIWLR